MAWICTDGRRAVERVRAYRITDADLDDLAGYLAAAPAPRTLPTVSQPVASTPAKEAA
ncbi:hypothetical protein [Pseudonocardia asaccharolytica]|uniref:Uncharacterized protein n=1 Tax=Pseudonocardia asaccharolytica DSM 44247 = NBRC 16224 TaxID=1123024 RepID=A0A511CUT4_9PSEU|nr:hypothetical protein [Pseudonocardia asaccharolytica]GEL16330.1 hypothetical protein PA7_01670 [Pseudonocardia asaccharolytica DSM 44247 = NBRC 16224]